MQPITNLSEGTGYAGAYQHIYLILVFYILPSFTGKQFLPMVFTGKPLVRYICKIYIPNHIQVLEPSGLVGGRMLRKSIAEKCYSSRIHRRRKIQKKYGERHKRRPPAKKSHVILRELNDLRCITYLLYFLQFAVHSGTNKVQEGASAWIAWLGWLRFWLFHPLPGSAWADGKLADLAEQLGKMVDHHRSNSTQQKYPSRCPSLYKGVDAYRGNFPSLATHSKEMVSKLGVNDFSPSYCISNTNYKDWKRRVPESKLFWYTVLLLGPRFKDQTESQNLTGCLIRSVMHDHDPQREHRPNGVLILCILSSYVIQGPGAKNVANRNVA